MRNETDLISSCSVVVMFLMMMKHMLNIVENYRDFLINDVQKLTMHNNNDKQSLFNVSTRK